MPFHISLSSQYSLRSLAFKNNFSCSPAPDFSSLSQHTPPIFNDPLTLSNSFTVISYSPLSSPPIFFPTHLAFRNTLHYYFLLALHCLKIISSLLPCRFLFVQFISLAKRVFYYAISFETVTLTSFHLRQHELHVYLKRMVVSTPYIIHSPYLPHRVKGERKLLPVDFTASSFVKDRLYLRIKPNISLGVKGQNLQIDCIRHIPELQSMVFRPTLGNHDDRRHDSPSPRRYRHENIEKERYLGKRTYDKAYLDSPSPEPRPRRPHDDPSNCHRRNAPLPTQKRGAIRDERLDDRPSRVDSHNTWHDDFYRAPDFRGRSQQYRDDPQHFTISHRQGNRSRSRSPPPLSPPPRYRSPPRKEFNRGRRSPEDPRYFPDRDAYASTHRERRPSPTRYNRHWVNADDARRRSLSPRSRRVHSPPPRRATRSRSSSPHRQSPAHDKDLPHGDRRLVQSRSTPRSERRVGANDFGSDSRREPSARVRDVVSHPITRDSVKFNSRQLSDERSPYVEKTDTIGVRTDNRSPPLTAPVSPSNCSPSKRHRVDGPPHELNALSPLRGVALRSRPAPPKPQTPPPGHPPRSRRGIVASNSTRDAVVDWLTEKITVQDLLQLRDVYMFGSDIDSLTFKMLQEILFSPTTGIPLSSLAPLSSALAVIPHMPPAGDDLSACAPLSAFPPPLRQLLRESFPNSFPRRQLVDACRTADVIKNARKNREVTKPDMEALRDEPQPARRVSRPPSPVSGMEIEQDINGNMEEPAEWLNAPADQRNAIALLSDNLRFFFEDVISETRGFSACVRRGRPDTVGIRSADRKGNRKYNDVVCHDVLFDRLKSLMHNNYQRAPEFEIACTSHANSRQEIGPRSPNGVYKPSSGLSQEPTRMGTNYVKQEQEFRSS